MPQLVFLANTPGTYKVFNKRDFFVLFIAVDDNTEISFDNVPGFIANLNKNEYVNFYCHSFIIYKGGVIVKFIAEENLYYLVQSSEGEFLIVDGNNNYLIDNNDNIISVSRL